MSKRVAVLGSNSFQGADFVDLLLDEPECEVLGISRSPEKSALFLPYRRRPKARFEFRQIDFNRQTSDLVSTLDAFEPAAIVNFAAQSEVGPSWEHPEHWFQTNTVALAELIKALCGRTYLKRYVHISSPEVYGACEGVVTEEAPVNPSTPYAASKAAADLLLLAYFKSKRFPVTWIRSTNVYGAHQQLWKIIPRTAIYLQLGRKIELHGGGKAVKSFIHVRDISRGELAVLNGGETGAIYHISPDRGHAVHDVVRRICERMGHDFAASSTVVAERVGQDAAYVIDSTKLRQKLGWKPEVSLDEGLQGVVDWVTSNWEEIRRQPLEYQHKA